MHLNSVHRALGKLGASATEAVKKKVSISGEMPLLIFLSFLFVCVLFYLCMSFIELIRMRLCVVCLHVVY